MKTIRFGFAAIVLSLFLCMNVWAGVQLTITDATGQSGDTITAAVILNDQAPAIRGADIRIGYDTEILIFNQGETADGNWIVSKTDSVDPDDSNPQSGEISIILGAIADGGLPAKTSATLVNLTFTISDDADDGTYALTYLEKRVNGEQITGLVDKESKFIPLTFHNGTVTVGDTTPDFHSGDYNQDYRIDLSELLRIIQIYNMGTYHCDADSEDGYNLGEGDRTCDPHSSDYIPQDWRINLSELLRAIQLYNAAGYEPDPDAEDGFSPL